MGILPQNDDNLKEVAEPCVTLRARGHLFIAKCPAVAGHHGGGRRGLVNGFSRSSRKRLLELLASLEPGNQQGRVVAVFLTLTFPGVPSPFEAKAFLQTFLKRAGRRFPGASGVWRLEFQRRGSPHFHLMLFGLPFWRKDEVQRVWGEVIGEDRPFTRIEAVRSWRQCIAYAAKYMSKPSEFGPAAPVSGAPSVAEQDGTGDGTGSGGFNYDAYLTDSETGEIFTGRVWGVFNRAGLPFGDIFEVTQPLGAWFWAFKRCGRRVWRRVNSLMFAGFTLFRDDPAQWIALARYLAG
jgi:hypothetical protein